MGINISNNELAQYYNFLMTQMASQNVTNTQYVANNQNVATQNTVNNITSEQVMNIDANQGITDTQNALLAYLTSKPADLNKVIPSFSGYTYTSSQDAALISGDSLINPKSYITSAIVIDSQVNALAGELFKSHVANFSVNEWRAVVEQAILANGGLGNNEDGFLAWSKDGHFVRLRNTNLTPEQNQKLASMSLEFGWAVEDLPSSKSENILGDESKIQELDARIAHYEERIEAFRQDPNQDFTLKYGKHRYTVSYDQQTGMFSSRAYKLRSGIKGWFDKCAKKISQGLGIAKNIFKFIPGWGTIVSACCSVTQKLTDFYRARNPLHSK